MARIPYTGEGSAFRRLNNRFTEAFWADLPSE